MNAPVSISLVWVKGGPVGGGTDVGLYATLMHVVPAAREQSSLPCGDSVAFVTGDAQPVWLKCAYGTRYAQRQRFGTAPLLHST